MGAVEMSMGCLCKSHGAHRRGLPYTLRTQGNREWNEGAQGTPSTQSLALIPPFCRQPGLGSVGLCVREGKGVGRAGVEGNTRDCCPGSCEPSRGGKEGDSTAVWEAGVDHVIPGVSENTTDFHHNVQTPATETVPMTTALLRQLSKHTF